MKRKMLIIAALSLILSGSSIYEVKAQVEEYPDDGAIEEVTEDVSDEVAEATDNFVSAKESLKWQGIYRGVMPCADCMGVLTEIELKDGNKCKVGRRYLGKEGDNIIKEGSFIWDKEGNHITITLPDERDELNQFAVDDGQLMKLDLQGEVISSQFPEYYTLSKPDLQNAIQDTYWKLIELNGQPVKKVGDDEAFFAVLSTGRMVGSTGCNSFVGSYDTDYETNIRVSVVAITLDGCKDTKYESDVMHVFAQTEKFDIDDKGILSLSQEGGQPFAKYQPVYFK